MDPLWSVRARFTPMILPRITRLRGESCADSSYAYVHALPTAHLDPSGLACDCSGVYWGAFAACTAALTAACTKFCWPAGTMFPECMALCMLPVAVTCPTAAQAAEVACQENCKRSCP